MKIKNILPALLVAVALSGCGKEDRQEVKDLFRPLIVSPVVVNNNITVAWGQLYEAVSYTLEAAYDQNFTNMLFTREMDQSVLKLTDLPYGTQVYFRLRANAADPVNSSTWVTFNATTARRITAPILKAVDKANIMENEVTVNWSIDPENPVDSIGVTPLDPLALAQPVGRYLTAEELEAGSAVLQGLEKNTVYRLNVYDTSKPGTYDKPYNERQFRTAGPPAGAIHIGPSDDLRTILSTNDLDPNIPQGTTYYIAAGSSYTMTGFTVTKGLRLVAAPGVRPKITFTSNFQFSGNISEFYIEGIDLDNPTAASYFVNNGSGGVEYTVEEFSLVDCTIKGCDRGFIRTQGAMNKTYGHILIDNCIINVVETYSGGGYGFIFMNSETDVVNALTVTNSTIYNTCMLGNELIDMNKNTGNVEILITNNTFYDSFKGVFLYMASLGSGNAVIQNNLFAGSAVSHDGFYRVSPEVVLTAGKNYYTNGYTGASGYPFTPAANAAVQLTATDEILFESPSTGNFTIIDKSSPAYLEQIGDPRWIK